MNACHGTWCVLHYNSFECRTLPCFPVDDFGSKQVSVDTLFIGKPLLFPPTASIPSAVPLLPRGTQSVRLHISLLYRRSVISRFSTNKRHNYQESQKTSRHAAKHTPPPPHTHTASTIFICAKTVDLKKIVLTFNT